MFSPAAIFIKVLKGMMKNSNFPHPKTKFECFS